jgi:hypothetical protein
MAIALFSSKNYSKARSRYFPLRIIQKRDRIQLQKTTPKILLAFQVFLEEILSAIASRIPIICSGIAKLI